MNKSDNNPKPSKEQERLIDAKVSLLQLAKELGNIRKACKAAGIARSSFYDIKKAYEQFGKDGYWPISPALGLKISLETSRRRFFKQSGKSQATPTSILQITFKPKA